MRFLLDVNVLLALLVARHLHHGLVSARWADHPLQGWGSCPLTQNGVQRVMSGSNYLKRQAPGVVAERIGLANAHASHKFWPDMLSLFAPGLLKWDRVLSSRQIMDSFLLALAVKNVGRLVTLDKGVCVQGVRDASPKYLLTLA